VINSTNAPGARGGNAFEFKWDIPDTFDNSARDLVSFACDTVAVGGTHCSGQVETGIILDDAQNPSTNGASSTGEFLDWCVDIFPTDGVCDTTRHPLPHGAVVPAAILGGPFPPGSNLLVRARFSADVNNATLCIDYNAGFFDPPDQCGDVTSSGESFDATTQSALAYSFATFTVPMLSFPVNADMGWYLFEDDDNFGGEADLNDAFCDTLDPVPVGGAANTTQDGGEGRTCLLDSHYVVAAVPAPHQVHLTNDESPAPGDQGPTFCQDANRNKGNLVLTGAVDQVIGCVFDQFALIEGTTDQKDPADLMGNVSVTFELDGPATFLECEGSAVVVSADGHTCHLENANLEVADNKYEAEWTGSAIPGGAPTAPVTITFCYDPEDNGCADQTPPLVESITKTLVAGIDHVHLRKTRNLTFHPNCHVGPVSITRRAGTRVSLTACLHDIFHNFSALDAPLAWRLDTSGPFTGADPARFVGQPDQCFGDDCDFTLDQFRTLFGLPGGAPITAGAFDGTGKAKATVTARPRAAGHLTRVFACLDLDQNGECDALQPSIVPAELFFFLTNTEALMQIHWK